MTTTPAIDLEDEPAPIGDPLTETGLGIAALVVNGAGLPLGLYLLVQVVPRFERMFASLGGKLPAVTIAVLNLSAFVISNAIWVVLAYGALVLAVTRSRRSLGAPLLALLLLHGIAWLLVAPLTVVAIFYPINELQKSLQ